jgi:oxygen-independent coproporphyrinogen-3 oxidase
LTGIKAGAAGRRHAAAMTDQLALLARNVPRYTSYPTAPHFSAAVRADVYAGWLRDLPAAATLSLYLHVPFCVTLCHYCGCNTKATRRRGPIERYAEVLQTEIALIGELAGRRKTVHLHWGGGTPSILGEDLLMRMIEALGGAFDLSALREHNIELDPRRVTRPLIRTLAAIGINRASLGVQDFAPHVQHAIGRIQPFELVERRMAMLREAGIERINIDLMYGLPRQSREDVARSAELAVSLRPQRIALFGYAHVPWFKKHQALIEESGLPGAEERLAQARMAADVFVAAGFEAIGLDHFARPDDELAIAARDRRLHRNFQGYTTDSADALIGLGASAIGKLPQGFVQNAPDVAGYTRAIDARRPATVKGLVLSDEDRLRAEIIERLMCDLSIDLKRFGGRAHFRHEMNALAPLADAGLVAIEGDTVIIAESGRPLLRLAAAAFDAYLPGNRTRHSPAV